MQAHAAYLRPFAAKGVAVAYGPVLDPKGSWGVAILSVDTADEVAEITKNDPVTLSGRGFSYEILPMATLVVGAPAGR